MSNELEANTIHPFEIYEILRESNRKSFQFFQMQSMLWEKLEIGTKAKTKLQP